MILDNKIYNYLKKECILEDEVQILEYIMNRKQQIIAYHTQNVCRIYCPGEGGTKFFCTKLTPKDRNHQNKIYSSTLEGLEDKIIAFYLKIEAENKISVRDILCKAVDENSKTGKRTIQRFDKRLSSIAKIKISTLSERHIKDPLLFCFSQDVDWLYSLHFDFYNTHHNFLRSISFLLLQN